MLLTREKEKLEGVGSLFGKDLHAWKTVLLEPYWPYYIVRLATKHGDDWKLTTFLIASEVDLAFFCYSLRGDNARRIEDITQLVTRRSSAEPSVELSTVVEIWECEECLEGETGGTTVILLDSNGKSVGGDSRSTDQVRIRSKCFPIEE